MKSIIASGAAALLFAASSAFAGTVTFPTDSAVQNSSSTITFNNGDVTVTAQAVYWAASGSSASVWSDSDLRLYRHNTVGLYAQNRDEVACYYYYGCYYSDEHLIDGQGRPEAVMFTFSEDVILNDIQFTTNYLDSQDGFTLLMPDGNGGYTWTRYNGVQSATGGTGIFSNFGAELIGKTFIVAAYGTDDFKIRALSYSAPMPEVPLPGALPMMATALVGFGMTRRKAKSIA